MLYAASLETGTIFASALPIAFSAVRRTSPGCIGGNVLAVALIPLALLA
jgi:hypothetical protein